MGEKAKARLPYFLFILYIICAHHWSFRRLWYINSESPFYKLEIYADLLAGGIVCFGGIALLWNRLLTNKVYWFLMVALLLIEQYHMRKYALNSSFLYKYLMIGVYLSLTETTAKQRNKFLGKVSRRLLSVALFFAALQKTFSEYYREGNLIASMAFFQGALHELLKKFSTSFNDALEPYHSAVVHMIQYTSISGASEVDIPPLLIWLAVLISIGSIIIEFAVAGLCLTKKTYESTLSFFLSLALVLGIYTLAEETLFLGLVCLMSYYAHDCKGPKAYFFIACFLYLLASDFSSFTPFFLKEYALHW